MIVQLAEGHLRTKYGEFREVLFYDGQKESIAFTMGRVDEAEEVLCRIHSSCIHGHYFNSVECECQGQLDSAQAMIQRAGRGIIILLDQEGKGNGHYALLRSIAHKRSGLPQSRAYEAAGFKPDNRDFSSAGKILQALGVRSVRLISDNPDKAQSLQQFGVSVVDTLPSAEPLSAADDTFLPATQNHISAILGMMERFYRIDGYPFDADKNRRNLELLFSNPELGRLWLIRRSRETVGYVVLAFGFSFEYGGRDAFIDELFIEASYRDQGLGRQTMEFVATQARELGVHAIHLEVENHNDKGNRLYEKQGFAGKHRAMLTKRL